MEIPAAESSVTDRSAVGKVPTSAVSAGADRIWHADYVTDQSWRDATEFGYALSRSGHVPPYQPYPSHPQYSSFGAQTVEDTLAAAIPGIVDTSLRLTDRVNAPWGQPSRDGA